MPYSKITGRVVEQLPHVLQLLSAVEDAYQMHGLLEISGPKQKIVDTVDALNLRLVHSLCPSVDVDRSFVRLQCLHEAGGELCDSPPAYRSAEVQLSLLDQGVLAEDAWWQDQDHYSWFQEVRLSAVWCFVRPRAIHEAVTIYKLLGYAHSGDGQTTFNLTPPFVETHTLKHWQGSNVMMLRAWDLT